MNRWLADVSGLMGFLFGMNMALLCVSLAFSAYIEYIVMLLDTPWLEDPVYSIFEPGPWSVLVWIMFFIPMIVWYGRRLRDAAAVTQKRLGQIPKG